ncbi:MAG: stage V sporulation protein AD [bacterium]|nr:stage V sporulation protein AD [bacterium]
MSKSSKMHGKQTLLFENPPYVLGYAAIAGKKEGEGPLGSYFDLVNDDPFFGMKTWEEAESTMQTLACQYALKKAGLESKDIRYLFGGDLLGQLIATSFGVISLEIPMFGIYGACSTMGEGISLAAMTIDGGFAEKTMAVTSSHFASAEKQFRFPLAYGNQRPYSATWTVTGSGAMVLGKTKTENAIDVVVKGITTGKVTDYGIKDSMNMGACMAPAAADVIYANLTELKRTPDYYDKIITGDLGTVGRDITIDILSKKGYDISKQYMDCGIEVFDPTEQDTHAGGSGCGCSGITLNGYIIEMLRRKTWNKVLFIPTGALLSPTSFNEGQTVPGVAHGVIFETV